MPYAPCQNDFRFNFPAKKLCAISWLNLDCLRSVYHRTFGRPIIGPLLTLLRNKNGSLLGLWGTFRCWNKILKLSSGDFVSLLVMITRKIKSGGQTWSQANAACFVRLWFNKISIFFRFNFSVLKPALKTWKPGFRYPGIIGVGKTGFPSLTVQLHSSPK